MRMNMGRFLTGLNAMLASSGLGWGLMGAEFGDYISNGDFNPSSAGVVREFELTRAYSVGTMNLSGAGLTFSGNGKLNAGTVNDTSSLGEKTFVSGVDWTLGALNMAHGTSSSHWVLSHGSRVEVNGDWKMFAGRYGTGRIGELDVTDQSHFCAKGGTNLGAEYRTTNCVVRLLVDNGTLEVPNSMLKLADYTPYAYLDIRNGGMVRVNGISTRTGSKATDRSNKTYGHPTSEVRVTLDDGTLEVGRGGLVAGAAEPMLPTFDIRNGVFRASDDWHWPASAEGTAQLPSITFGANPCQPGQVVFDTNGKSLEFSPIIGGCSEVTLTGEGSVATTNYLQGVVSGKWTVEAGVDARLDAISGFAGGIELAGNAQASICFGGGENCVDAGVFSRQHRMSMVNYNGPLPMIVDNLDYAHQRVNPARLKFTSFMYRGEFYVEKGKEGTWYFGGTFDNGLYFEVDHQKVLMPSDWGMVDAASVNLNVGWHPFTLVCYSANGKSGPLDTWDQEGFEDGEVEAAVLPWGIGRISVGWSREAPADPKDPRYYTRFDMHSLRMRRAQLPAGGRPSSVRWRAKSGADPEWDDYDGAYSYLHGFYPCFHDGVTNSLQGVNEPGYWRDGKNCTSSFTGYFFVEDNQVGDWNFIGRYGDYISLRIDDRRILAAAAPGAEATGSAALAAGWHSFDVRCVNNAGASASNAMRDDDGHAANLLAVLPSGARRVFDERSFRFAVNTYDVGVEKGCGIGGVLKLNAGSTFANRAENGYCPIYGRLEGTGTLQGPFAFTSQAVWAITGVSDQLQLPTFTRPWPQMHGELRRIELTLDRPPLKTSYPLGPALGLTQTAAAKIEVSVTVLGAAAADAIEYRHRLRAVVENGELKLIPRFKGFVILLQ